MLDRDQYICVLDMKEDLGLTQEELDALICLLYTSYLSFTFVTSPV